jgi:hypothetical protein
VTPHVAKLAVDRSGDVIALVEKRGGRPAYDAVVHVYDGRTLAPLASFEGPKLSYLRLAVLGDRIVVGDYLTGKVVGVDLAGRVAWSLLSVRPETLDSLKPSLDGKLICAWVTEPGVVRRVPCIDARAGSFVAEQTEAFSSLPFNIGKMLLAACWSNGVVVASGWAEDASAPVGAATRKFETLFGVASTPRVPRLVGLSFTGGAAQFVDLAPTADGTVIGLVTNENIDPANRDATRLFATSSLVRFDPMTGAETARVDLGAALAQTRDASLFAFGTRLVATDGSIRDTVNGAVVGRLP